MSPADTGEFIARLEAGGLEFHDGTEFVDTSLRHQRWAGGSPAGVPPTRRPTGVAVPGVHRAVHVPGGHAHVTPRTEG